MYVEYIQLDYNGLYLTMTTRQIKHYNHYYTNSSLDYIYIYTLRIQTPPKQVRLTPPSHHTPVTLPKKIPLDP